MAPTLYFAAAFGLAAALLYAFVGRSVQRRQVSERNQLANQLFATWWYGLGFATGLGGVVAIAYETGQRELSFHFTILLLNLLVICIALFALLYYLVFLFTGQSAILKPLAVGYVAYFFLLLYFLIDQQPNGVVSDGWSAQVSYAAPDKGILYAIIIVLLVFPQIIGAFALLSFAFRLGDLGRRIRVTVVGISILVWFGSAFVGAAIGVSSTNAWQIASRIIGLAAALAILLAYRPPAFIRQRFAKGRANESTSKDPEEVHVSSVGSRSSERSTPSGTAW